MAPTADDPGTERWHDRPLPDVCAALGAEPVGGLPAAEAAARLERDGPNELRRADSISRLRILARQFRSVMIWVLIGAALVAAALGELLDGGAIVTIVVLNAVIGFFQEHRAEHAVAALGRLAAPRARVVRDGRGAVVPAAEVVRGDLVVLGPGDLVAADVRLLEAAGLRAAEAALTGESEPIEKRPGICSPATPLADRTNMLFLGTSVVAGSGRAVVVATGMSTELGRIAGLLETASHGATPLERQLAAVGRRLLWVCLAIVLVVFGLGLGRGTAPLELFMSAVSLAVAAVPEGLPAVVTIALALGVQRMAWRRALVRRLPAVETLGCAEVVCTDKTGTLTRGEMTVRTVVTAEGTFDVAGEGYAVAGTIGGDGAADDVGLRALLVAAAACGDAELTDHGGQPAVVGDPTEGALLVLAAKGGVDRPALEAAMPRLGAVPFDSDRKRMTVVRRRDGQPWAFVKGAPEVILERCTRIRTAQGAEPLGEGMRARMRAACARLTDRALRILALAERPLARWAPDPDPERDLVLLGLVAMQDPPRPEARAAVARCRRAGVRTVMITGDHPQTARAIAREVGILGADDEVLVGDALDALTDEELAERVARIAVYARVTAEHKLRIVRAWKARGAVVAMTGDGVNDAPALKEASIGIAMGRTGTEVTKEAADLVISDDDFASIVAAMEEGRGIYDNIAKTLAYLLAGNAGELAVMLVAGLVGWPLPLLPIQLLWVNLVTDSLPALALATDPIDPSVLERPPRRPEAQLMDRRFLVRVALTGCMTAGVTLVAFAHALHTTGSAAAARNAAFAVLVFEELLRSFSARSTERTLWEVGALSNLRLVVIVAASGALQLVLHHVPALARVFGTLPMTLSQGLAWIALGALPVTVLEVAKLLRRRRPARAPVRRPTG